MSVLLTGLEAFLAALDMDRDAIVACIDVIRRHTAADAQPAAGTAPPAAKRAQGLASIPLDCNAAFGHGLANSEIWDLCPACRGKSVSGAECPRCGHRGTVPRGVFAAGYADGRATSPELDTLARAASERNSTPSEYPGDAGDDDDQVLCPACAGFDPACKLCDGFAHLDRRTAEAWVDAQPEEAAEWEGIATAAATPAPEPDACTTDAMRPATTTASPCNGKEQERSEPLFAVATDGKVLPVADLPECSREPADPCTDDCAARVLRILQAGPALASDLPERTGLVPHVVPGALATLKARGLAVKLARGFWGLPGDTIEPPEIRAGPWTEEEDAKLRELAPTRRCVQVAHALQRTESSVHSRAKRLGVVFGAANLPAPSTDTSPAHECSHGPTLNQCHEHFVEANASGDTKSPCFLCREGFTVGLQIGGCRFTGKQIEAMWQGTLTDSKAAAAARRNA